MAKAFYLTTPLYYVNAQPHLGHAYTTIAADALARWHRQRGDDVFLLTGTDEHGEKVARAAKEQGLAPQAFADQTSQTFRSLWKALGISFDFFIRTTDPGHERVVQRVLQALYTQGALRPGRYTFWYCVPCETSWALGDFADGGKKACPSCGRGVEEVTEEDYFLDLEAHRPWLREHIRSHPEFLRPDSRRNEILAMLEKELPPLCVTRPKERVGWGIGVPFSSAHVTYVWFDALLNYISALGWPDGQRFRSHWEGAGAIHLVGKDILRHHGLYWPILLHALGVAPPKTVFAHGWWLITPPPAPATGGGPAFGGRPEGPGSGGGVKGEKMSKSRGNVIDPESIVAAYGLDPLRYFLLREIPFGEDGVFSEEALVKRINADLANDLGNLVYRTLTMIEKHAAGRVTQLSYGNEFQNQVANVELAMQVSMNRLMPSEALKGLWKFIAWANLLVEKTAPWALAREGKRAELALFLYQMAESLRITAIFLWPFLPNTAESIWRQLGFDSDLGDVKLSETEPVRSLLAAQIPGGLRVRKDRPLFPRLM